MIPKLAKSIHFTELPPATPNMPLAIEWETYRREVGRLLAEGQEGKHVLIHGDEVLGVFSTREEATFEGDRRFLLKRESYMVRPVLTLEPLLRTRMAG